MNSVDQFRWCPGCSQEQPFETPECQEHGSACPEFACVICGWALVGEFEVAAARPIIKIGGVRQVS